MIKQRSNKTPVEPYYPCVLDIETDATDVIGLGFGWEDENGELQYRRYEGFDDFADDFCEIYKSTRCHTKQKRLRRIYAHYGAGFDWLFFIVWATDSHRLNDFQFFYSDSFPIGARIRIAGLANDCFIDLRDSFRLLPASLDKLGRTFGIESPKLDLAELLPGIKPEDRPAWLKRNDPDTFWHYLETDVRGLQQVLKAFWTMIYEQDGDIGQLPMTLPSLSMRLFTKMIEQPIKTSWNTRVIALERDSYVGGRTECYRPGETDISIYDFNSIYPSVMLSGVFPVSYRGGWTDRYTGEHGIYTGRFAQHNRNAKPVLRDARTNAYVYEGSGSFCKPEIDLLLEIGGTFECEIGWVYAFTGNPFRRFISTWWARRARAQDVNDEAMSYVAKILMNSLYGKLAQKTTHETVKYLSPTEQQAMLANGQSYKMLGEFSIVTEEEQHDYVFVAIASYVTAYARVRLYRAMHDAEQQGYDVWYCDTDSVHTTGNLPEIPGLGGIKREYTGTAAYAGKKLYALKEPAKVKAKGMPIALLSYDHIKQIALDADAKRTYDYHDLPTWRDVLSGTVKPGEQRPKRRSIKQTTKG